MKKAIIVILMITIIGVGYFLINSNKNIDKILSKFESYEKDGFYEKGELVEGYLVSNKTKDGYRYGYVNYKGKILLEAEYNHIHRVMGIPNKDKVYLIAAKNGRYGVNFNGKDIIGYEYQFIDYDSQIEGFILQKSNNYGVANIEGKIIIPVQNKSVEIKGEYIYVSHKEENKVYNKNGEIQDIDFNTSINQTENENYSIKTVIEDEHYLYGVIGKDGEELIKAKYTYIEYLFEDYFIACNSNGKEGIININDEVELEFEYSLVQEIQNTNLIRTLNNETNETEIYNRELKKLCSMTNANITNEAEKIKISNEKEEKYFDKNGIEINK